MPVLALPEKKAEAWCTRQVESLRGEWDGESRDFRSHFSRADKAISDAVEAELAIRQGVAELEREFLRREAEMKQVLESNDQLIKQRVAELSSEVIAKHCADTRVEHHCDRVHEEIGIKNNGHLLKSFAL